MKARRAARFRVDAVLRHDFCHQERIRLFHTCGTLCRFSRSRNPIPYKNLLIRDSAAVFYGVPAGNLSALIFFSRPGTPVRTEMAEMALQSWLVGHFPIHIRIYRFMGSGFSLFNRPALWSGEESFLNKLKIRGPRIMNRAGMKVSEMTTATPTLEKIATAEGDALLFTERQAAYARFPGRSANSGSIWKRWTGYFPT